MSPRTATIGPTAVVDGVDGALGVAKGDTKGSEKLTIVLTV